MKKTKKYPPSLKPYTDKYFLRSVEILQKDELNPFVRAQIFIRIGPGTVHGIEEAVSLVRTHQTGEVIVQALRDGDHYEPSETIMTLEGRALDVIPLETVVLGVISAETTKANDKTTPDLRQVKERIEEIVRITKERDVVYFGARHWRYDMDEKIAEAAFSGGAVNASTDIGAAIAGKQGVGTIPHSLECIYAFKFGLNRAVVESTRAFDRHIDTNVPRIALIDFANREVDDTLAVAESLGRRLYGVRVDTCGENTMQGADTVTMNKTKKFWHGTGVTIAGVYNLRRTLDKHGYSAVKIMLTSGFGDAEKARVFVDAEKELGVRLFDSLGVGQVYPTRPATMDIIRVGDTSDSLKPISKIGRFEKPNSRLQVYR